jgi:hypothetical protein
MERPSTSSNAKKSLKAVWNVSGLLEYKRKLRGPRTWRGSGNGNQSD